MVKIALFVQKKLKKLFFITVHAGFPTSRAKGIAIIFLYDIMILV